MEEKFSALACAHMKSTWDDMSIFDARKLTLLRFLLQLTQAVETLFFESSDVSFTFLGLFPADFKETG